MSCVVNYMEPSLLSYYPPAQSTEHSVHTYQVLHENTRRRLPLPSRWIKLEEVADSLVRLYSSLWVLEIRS